MTFIWILLGALMASALWMLYVKVHITRAMSTASWVLSVISVLWGAFTLAWVLSSLSEGETQAAGMGLLVFGIILVLLIFITRSLITGTKFWNNKHTRLEG